jgi:urease accessory protein
MTSQLDEAALYRLLAWLSPSYPIGAFSYSHGLEYAIEAGLVKDRATLIPWLAHILQHGAAWVDAVLLREAHAAHDDAARLDELADLAAAWRGTSETALESAQQGGSFLTITRAAWPHPALDAFAAQRQGRIVALPIALGLAGAAQAVPVAPLIAGYLHAFAANLASAAMRIIPLGQTDGQKALAALAPVVATTVQRALIQPLERLASAAPMVDWASMNHETQYTRLFRS